MSVKNSLVSIVIPAYNCEPYIRQTILSAFHQADAQTEIIVVDDGSTDDTAAVLNELLQAWPRLRVIRQENRGVSAARNIGIEHARGEYIMFLDSDDMLCGDCVHSCLEKFRETNAEIVLFSAKAFCDGMPDELLKSFNYQRPDTGTIPARSFLEEAIENNRYTVSPCLYMARRDVIGPLRFPEGQVHEDNEFTTSLLLQHISVAATSVPLYQRRLRPNSIMTQPRSARHVDGLLKAASAISRLSSAPGIRVGLGRALNKVIGNLLFEAARSQGTLQKGLLSWKFRLACWAIVYRCRPAHIRPKTLLAALFPELFGVLRRLKRAFD
jgi:hypothetical protein